MDQKREQMKRICMDKKKNPKISVVMPCLNMVHYIKECLDSVVNQTLAEIEIIIIDAGSIDGTQNIIKEYASMDSRVKILLSDMRSYGYQVNLGVEAAIGEYIAIVDTDDRIVLDTYEVLYTVAEETKADYVKGTAEMFYTFYNGLCYCRSISQFMETQYGQKGRIELCPKNMPSLIMKDNFLWYGIYRADFLKRVKLNQTYGAAFQDFGGLLQTQLYAEKAVYISKKVYEYRQDNVNSSNYNKKGFHFIAEEYQWAQRFIEDQTEEWKGAFYHKLFLHFMDRMYAMAASGIFWEDTFSDMEKIAERLRWAYTEKLLTKEQLNSEEWNDMCMLWSSPYDLYIKYREMYVENKKALQYIYKNIKGKIGIIFGAGRLGTFIHAQFLSRSEKNIAAYCDNKAELVGKQQYGIDILSPKQAIKNFSQAIFIIALKYGVETIKEQLLELGVDEKNILVSRINIDFHLFGEVLEEVC